MISLSGALFVVLAVVVVGAIFGLFVWFIDWCETPEPARRIARVILGAVFLMVMVALLLTLVGGQQVFRL